MENYIVDDSVYYDFSKMNIEHVLPDVEGNYKRSELGNLLILSKKLNNKIANADYSKKRIKFLESKDIYVRNFAANYENFTEDDISKRTTIIAKQLTTRFCLMKKEVERVNKALCDKRIELFINQNERAYEIYKNKGIKGVLGFYNKVCTIEKENDMVKDPC